MVGNPLIDVPLKDMVAVGVLLQIIWLATDETVGAGFTIIVKLCRLPVQPLATGVAVMVAVVATVPLFKAVNEPIVPVPIVASPMLPLLFVQL